MVGQVRLKHRAAQQQHIARQFSPVAIGQFPRPLGPADHVAQQNPVPRFGARQPQSLRGIVAPQNHQPPQPPRRRPGLQVDQQRQSLGIGSRQNLPQHPARRHGSHRRGRVSGGQKLAHLGPHPFARQPVQPAQSGSTGRQPFGIGAIGGIAMGGVEPEEPQDTQIILGDPRRRVADKPHPPRQQVGQAAQRINHRAIGLGIERIHGEIPPRSVFGQRRAEPHHGMAAIGGQITPKAGHLIGQTVGHHRNRAMVDPGRHRAQPRRRSQSDDLFGPGIGGEIDIHHRHPQQGIPDRPPHHQRLMPGHGQHGANTLRLFPVQPGTRQLHRAIRSASPRNIRAVAPQI